MTTRSTRCPAATASATALLIAAAFAVPLCPSASWAQAAGMAGIGQSDSITISATVRSVDPATRGITLVGPASNTVSVVAGPQVINFDRIKAGDRVTVQYQESVSYVLSPPNAKAPANSLTAAAVGAPKGAMPAGGAAARTVVTGLVVGLDASNHTLQMVALDGGAIHTLHVVSPEGQQNFHLVKVGDRITEVTTQAIAAVVAPGG